MTDNDPQTLPLDVALQQAVAHHEAGRLQEAEQLYRDILQALPNQPDANHNLGVLAMQIGRHVDGLPHLKAALEANPAEGQYWLSYAEALLSAGLGGDALGVIQAAIQRGLDTPEALALRQKAEAAVQGASATTNAPAPSDLGSLYELFNSGRYGELEEQAHALTERFPDSGVAWKIFGTSLIKQGKKALPAMEKAVELLPDDAEAHSNLSAVQRSTGQLDKAAASSRRALELKPDFAEAHNNLGIALQALGQFDGAVGCYRRALALKPDYADAQQNLAIAQDEIKKINSALAEAAVKQTVTKGNALNNSASDAFADVPFARLMLIVACLVVYVRFLNNPAVFDDVGLIGNKALLNAYGHSLFFDFTLRWFSYVTFGWTDRLLGASIVWHRVVNLTLHISVALALYNLLKQLFRSALPVEANVEHPAARYAFWGALIFAVHPMAVYGTGYLIERSIVMATLFSILAMLAFVKGLGGEGRKWYFIAGAWYFVAVFSKEHAVMLPLAMAAIIPLVRRDYRVLLRELGLPFLVFFGIALLIALKRQGLLGVAYEPHAMAMLASAAKSEVHVETATNPHYLSIVLQGYLFFKYLLLWLLPNVGWMSVDLQQKFPNALLQWPESAGFLLFAVYPIVTGLLLWRGGKRGLLGYALLFPWLMFFTEFASVRIVEAFTLYRSYLWMMCLPLILPLILGKIDPRRENVVLAVVVAGLVLLSWNRLNTFTSDFKLWDDVVMKLSEEKTPGMYRAFMNRGIYRGEESTTKAFEDFNKAIEINPDHPGPYLNRGAMKGAMKLYLEAYEDLNRAIELDPALAEGYVNRGMAQIGLGNRDKGVSDIAYGVSLQPENERYRKSLEQWKQ